MEYYKSLVGCHTEISANCVRFKFYISWPNTRKGTEDCVRKCVSCQKNKHTVPNTNTAMEITDTPCATFDKINMGCMDPLSLTEKKNKYILSCQDQLSKYLDAIPIRNKEVETIAERWLTM